MVLPLRKPSVVCTTPSAQHPWPSKPRRSFEEAEVSHMGASLAVKEAAEGQAGRERLAMEAFARALENIPSTLAQNAGVDRLNTLLALRAEHRNGTATAGIDAEGKVAEIQSTWLP